MCVKNIYFEVYFLKLKQQYDEQIKYDFLMRFWGTHGLTI